MPQLVIENNPNVVLPDIGATAVIYLRVSSTGQLTGRSQEGYSIEGQREACERHAERLGATIIREYVEPGKSATSLRRPRLQEMLSELGDLKPTYVIFYDLSRVARDEFDAFWLLREIESNGSKLESTLERISNDDSGMLLYTVMAGVNAHRSRSDGRKVKMGLDRKFADGGTHGAARIGYLNTREVVNGKEVRSIATDPERVELVQLGFEAFATGEYSITTLREMLEGVGLRSRPTPKRPAKPLSRNGIYRMLRDDYYIGTVTRGGAKREGRHDAIIDRQVFEKVQRTLDAHRLSGDRTKKHAHHLKGSIFCGHCGLRLLYGRHRGNGGVYEYFSCMSHQARRPSCGARYIAVDAVERAIERYYRQVELTLAETEDVRRQLREQIGVRLEVARKQSETHKRKLRDLQNEQQKLLQLFYRDGVDEEVLQVEQARIETERSQARRWIDSATHEADEANAALDEALAIIQGCHATYMAADSELRRLMNQAIFTRLLVRTDELEGEAAPVFGHIRSLSGSSTPVRAKGPRNGQDPRLSGGLGSNVGQLVRARGLEPPRACAHRLLKPACLPIPPRPRRPARPTQPLQRTSQAAARACIVRYAMSSQPTRERKNGVIITHPNRDKPVVQATRAIVVALLLISAGLVLIVTIGGWNVLEGAIPVQIGYIAVYLLFAFYAARWNRGVLPISAVLGVFLAIFALVAGPGWFDRNKSGFAQPSINAGLLGVLTLLIVPVQILLVTFTMRGFSQGWNVELERRDPAAGGDGGGDGLLTPPYPA
jgi:site-specific DNA recombinase